MDAQIPEARETFAQRLDQVPVQLHRIQRPRLLQETPGNGPLAWSDLHQALARSGPDGVQDAADGAGVMQEVLAEAFAWLVHWEKGQGNEVSNKPRTS